MTDIPIEEAKLVGGSPQDRRRLLQRLHEYLDINARFDWEPLQDLWSSMPEAVFFNLNGHTYNGRAHWTRLWQFYQKNVASSYWTPFDIGGVVSDELAVIWCHRRTRSDWVGEEPPVGPRRYGNEHITSLDDGIPQGGRGLARCPRPFLRGRVDPAAGRHMSVAS